MFKLELNKNDRAWLKERHPGLTITKENKTEIVSGDFHFDAVYYDQRLTDTYKIRIELQASEVSDLPRVIETESRVRKISEERNVPLVDLHSYDDSSACLCVRLAEPGYFPNGFSFPIFMEDLVIPYFYAQRYFEDFNTWPWKSYSHGLLGWFEWYYEQENMTFEIADGFIEKLKSTKAWPLIQNELTKKRGVKGHHLCICGSSVKYRKCHNNVFLGVRKLQQDVAEFGLLN